MGQATSKGDKGKSEIKQPSDIPPMRFEHGSSDLQSNMLPLDHGGSNKNIKYAKFYCSLLIIYKEIAVSKNMSTFL